MIAISMSGKCLSLRGVIKAPDEVIDYIIIHELCHFLIKDHSHRYWNLLKAYVKDYKRKIEWLDVNGKYLLSQ
jgi:predicted metal-dependent hydrolase